MRNRPGITNGLEWSPFYSVNFSHCYDSQTITYSHERVSLLLTRVNATLIESNSRIIFSSDIVNQFFCYN